MVPTRLFAAVSPQPAMPEPYVFNKGGPQSFPPNRRCLFQYEWSCKYGAEVVWAATVKPLTRISLARASITPCASPEDTKGVWRAKAFVAPNHISKFVFGIEGVA